MSTHPSHASPRERLAALLDLLAPEAEAIPAAGDPTAPSTGAPPPFRLSAADTADTAWFLAAGQVEIFAVDVIAGTAGTAGGGLGARTHLSTLQPGQMIFGLGPPAGDHRVLLAVALPGTRLLRLALPRLRQMARDPGFAADLAAWVDGWVEALTAEIPAAAPPQLFVELRPGAEARLASPQLAARPAAGVVWVRHVAGRSLFLGAAELALDAQEYLLPLGRRTWIESTTAVELSAVDTRILLKGGGLWEGLARFHQLFLRLLDRELGKAQAADRLRLDRREERDRAAVAQAHARLAEVLGELPGPPLATVESEEPLLLACRQVGRAQGLDIRSPAPGGDTGGGTGGGRLFERICAASRLRSRRVLLRDDWWRRDNGPLLGFRLAGEGGEGGAGGAVRRPVALLPTSPAAYELLDPVSGERRPVDAALAESLAGDAVMFYAPLPDRPVGWRDLLALALRGNRRDLLNLVLLGSGGGLLALLVPLATAQIFGTIIPGADRRQLLEMTLGLTAGAFAGAAFQVSRSLAVLRLGARFDGAVQAAVWDRLLSLPVAFFRRFTVGDLAARSMGIDAIRDLLTGNAVTSLLGAIFSLASFALLFVYSRRLALVAAALVALLLAVTAGLVYLQLRQQRLLLALEGRIASLLFGFLNAIAKLRVAGAERRAYALWAERFAEQRRRSIEAQRLANLQTAWNAAYGVLSLLSLFAMAGAASGENLSTAEFLAFTAAFGQFQAAALSLIGLLSSLLTLVPVYERLLPILSTPPEVAASQVDAGELAGDVEVSHLSFRYKEDGPLVLDDVSLRARPGELIALVGPSGSGKSTCLRLLLGFERPAAGSIYFDGQDLPSLDIRSVRRQIGVVLQNGRPLVGSLYSNIVGDAHLGLDAAWEAARMAGLEDDIRAMPMGMHTMVSEGAGTFSGGQRQRLLIARALVHRPRILLFDEATSALDNRTQEIVRQSLASLKATRIVVAHRLSTILGADRIYVLAAGRVVEAGTFDELNRQGGLFARLVARQTA